MGSLGIERAVDRRTQIPGLIIAGVNAAAEQRVVVGTCSDPASQRESAGHRGAAVDGIDHKDAVAGGQRTGAACIGNPQQRIATCGAAVDDKPVRGRAVSTEKRIEAERAAAADVVPRSSAF